MGSSLCCHEFVADPLAKAREAVDCTLSLASGRTASLISDEMTYLEDAKYSITEYIEVGMRDKRKPTAEAATWLEDAEKLMSKAAEFRESVRQIQGFSLLSYYRLGCLGDNLRDEFLRLTARRRHLTVLEKADPLGEVDPLELCLQRLDYDETKQVKAEKTDVKWRDLEFPTVLDLSNTRIRHLPPDIRYLFKKLRILNLSSTLLERLPAEVGYLRDLRILRLDFIFHLQRIPKEAILPLSELQVLSVYGGSYDWTGVSMEGDEVCLEDLVHLQQLEVVNLAIRDISQKDLNASLNSRRLFNSIKDLHLRGIHSLSSIDLFGAIRNVEVLVMEECNDRHWIIPTPGLRELEHLSLFDLQLETFSWMDESRVVRELEGRSALQGLRFLDISQCDELKAITWIRNLPCLDSLCVRNCSSLVEIVAVEESENDRFFPRLRRMTLANLPSLKSICRKPLLFPYLEEVDVVWCPRIKNLPFGLDSAKSLRRLSGDLGWWEDLEFDDMRVRSTFAFYFVTVETLQMRGDLTRQEKPTRQQTPRRLERPQGTMDKFQEAEPQSPAIKGKFLQAESRLPPIKGKFQQTERQPPPIKGKFPLAEPQPPPTKGEFQQSPSTEARELRKEGQ